MSFRRRAILVLLSALMSACATQVAVKEARQLYSQGKVEESLARRRDA